MKKGTEEGMCHTQGAVRGVKTGVGNWREDTGTKTSGRKGEKKGKKGGGTQSRGSSLGAEDPGRPAAGERHSREEGGGERLSKF